jgi:hypothetical protein
MRKSSSGHAGEAIERFLELSADAQITRRKILKDSPAFHRLTGAIAAYGKALALLTALQRRERILISPRVCEEARDMDPSSACDPSLSFFSSVSTCYPG